MVLSRIEFIAMNNPVRRLIQKHFEFRKFQKMGLVDTGMDILEIGCGSGYAAVLLSKLNLKSYVGIDLMPEQIMIAGKRKLPGYEFIVMDATDLGRFSSGSRDIVVIFGILHHIPEWRKVLAECGRVLKKGGMIFLDEPGGRLLRPWDRIFRLGHPEEGYFTLEELGREIEKAGFTITGHAKYFGFGIYAGRKG